MAKIKVKKSSGFNNDRLVNAMFHADDERETTATRVQKNEMRVFTEKKPDTSGFFNLDATDEGNARMEKIRASKKTLTVKPMTLPKTPEPWETYDTTAMKEILNKAIGFIKNGKFGKAFVDHESEIVKKFIELYDQIPKDNEKISEFNEVVKMLIIICKSYYEYDDKHRSYLQDNDYDKILAKYLACGNEEPIGISVGRTKIAIKYPTLHNNMDKAYILNSSDPIPNGVKESDSIENFLLRVYKALGITSETEIKLEISPKIDGVSVNGTIKGDALVDPQTRGDVDESVVLPGMSGIQVGDGDKIADSEFGIQYECFVTEEDRIEASMYLKLETPYVSCRHAAAGITQRLSVKEDDRLLQFISLYPINTEGLDGTYEERMDFIQNFGIVPKDMISRKTIKGSMKQLIKAIDKIREDYVGKRPELSYAIDGLVITVVDDDYQNAIGRNGRTNRYQIALKFDPETAEAVVKGIHLDSGSKGFRTIQVDLEKPVFIGGVRYNHVPVLSAGIFNNMRLRYGAKIKVFRAGDVIPSIEVIDNGSGSMVPLPEKCPRCGTRLEIKSKKLFCKNYDCRDNRIGRAVAYVKGIGVEGYDETNIMKMADEYFADDAKRLDVETKCVIAPNLDIDTLYKFNDEKFHAALVEATKNCPDYKILGSIGIPDLGPARAKIFLKGAKGFDNLLKEWDYLNNFKGLEETMPLQLSCIIRSVLNNGKIRDMLKFIRKYMENITTDFSNKITVGHTGYTPSEKVIELCRDNNFDITDGKKFDLLITGDFSSTSDKMKKAIDNNIPVYSEEALITRFGDHGYALGTIYEKAQLYEPNRCDDPVEKYDYYPVVY